VLYQLAPGRFKLMRVGAVVWRLRTDLKNICHPEGSEESLFSKELGDSSRRSE
jgi:hypothetical protein